MAKKSKGKEATTIENTLMYNRKSKLYAKSVQHFNQEFKWIEWVLKASEKNEANGAHFLKADNTIHLKIWHVFKPNKIFIEKYFLQAGTEVLRNSIRKTTVTIITIWALLLAFKKS